MIKTFNKTQTRNLLRLKILIAHASQFGSTVEVAESMSKTLRKRGATVTVKPISSVKDIHRYNAIVIGSPIQYDRWRPEAEQFVQNNLDALQKIPVACFFTCLVLSKKTAKANKQAQQYASTLKKIASKIHPVSIGAFAGVLDYSKMTFFQRLLAEGIFAILGIKEGDYRDWTAIRSWAANISFTQ